MCDITTGKQNEDSFRWIKQQEERVDVTYPVNKSKQIKHKQRAPSTCALMPWNSIVVRQNMKI